MSWDVGLNNHPAPPKFPGAQPPTETCARCDGAGGDEHAGPCTDCLGEGALPVDLTNTKEHQS